MSDSLGRLRYRKLPETCQELEVKGGAKLVGTEGVSDPGLAPGACAVFTEGDAKNAEGERLRRR